MIHHYVQRGFTVDHLLNLSYTERMFMMASMRAYYEEEAAKWSSK